MKRKIERIDEYDGWETEDLDNDEEDEDEYK